MKAFGYEQNGGPEVFKEYQVPIPEISGNQLLIKTQAFNLNNFERAQRAGEFKATDHRIIPGRDVAGIIDQVGSDVSGFKIGDRVVAHGHHSYAEYAIGEDTNTVKLPDNVSFTQAAGIVTPGLAAYKGLHLFADVKKGQTVIVKGASGGVGSIAAQVALDLGAKVIGVGASRNADYVKSLGVSQYVAYDQQDPAEVLADAADVVLDAALNGNGNDSDVHIVKNGGIIATVGDAEPATNKDVSFKHIHPTQEISDTTALAALLKLMSENKLSIKIGYQLPFTIDGVIKGHQILESKHDGRVVVSKD
ncbi:NADP-dependent oxidoreductase [Lentilactobacillus hilgardii]|uniref:Zinc-binding dehydrogenase n=1 Tax=Lentilactobacillus hilgardii TaxID=1588 RepID=A0A6P1E5I7_LENHI|nr:NADP-dependent oxidoreductase [Lentilactobacillus hilgardii]EEI70530.1 GroES-like protein [Lentilactobacillus hilgardii ATCC 27305]MCT3397146.1 NADP-dependent oxidoreductase [Lentilactobacillus hilgardii]QHB51829.1 zinc-binding dehydrogenase [Lentilactobacillus hilgardii]RRG07722.1 MAG: NADP-dependent oxidoreductase [Lactobacillus sp.]